MSLDWIAVYRYLHVDISGSCVSGDRITFESTDSRNISKQHTLDMSVTVGSLWSSYIHLCLIACLYCGA